MSFQVYNEELLKSDWAINGNRPYQQCSLSVMDTIADPNIRFDEKGVSNYYYNYMEAETKFVFRGKEGDQRLTSLIKQIIKDGHGLQYDCIVGVSGGVDSTYLVLQAKKLG